MNHQNRCNICYHSKTIVGEIYVSESQDKISFIGWGRPKQCTLAIDAKHNQIPWVVEECLRQIEEYLSGSRKHFDLQLFVKGTPFQEAVWRAIYTVGYGNVLTYTHLAERAGFPKAVRAVANACGANKIAIVIPCHRIVAKMANNGGYAYGLGIKNRLLNLEANKRSK